MKKLKHLRASWYFSSMAAAVVVGLMLGNLVEKSFGLHVPMVPLAALCIGAVALVVSLIYDGND